MGSPISSTLAEIYLQHLEETYIKYHLEKKEIVYYKRYMDDILIIFDHSKITRDMINIIINNIDEHLEFNCPKRIMRT
jgi:hypothetical protein